MQRLWGIFLYAVLAFTVHNHLYAERLLLSKDCNLTYNHNVEDTISRHNTHDAQKSAIYTTSVNQIHQVHQAKKKKIVLVMCKGGYGHVAACQTLTECLSPYYDVSTIDFIDTIYNSLDPVRTITFGKANGNDMYNGLLQSGWIRLSNWVYRNVAPTAILSSKKKIEKRTFAFLEKEKPDMLISALPIFNLPMSNAAKKSGIPFILVTLDSDLTNWLLNLHKISHQNFVITINNTWQGTEQQLKNRGIKPENIKNIGFPRRKDFLAKKNLSEIRKQWNIPDNKFVIMIMMGGTGSNVAYKYAKKIAQMKNLTTHVLVCVGRSTQLIKKLNKLKPEPGVSLSAIPFTKQISDLMAVSNLLITKTGPGSIDEAIHMQLPMLLDKTNQILFWERANVDLVKHQHYGDVVKSFSDLERLINKYVTDATYYATVKNNLKKHTPYIFDREIVKLVANMFPIGQTQVK